MINRDVITKLGNATVLYAYPRLSPPRNCEEITSLGGAERRLVELAVQFCRLGMRVIVASDDSHESAVIKKLRRSGVEFVRIPFGRKSPLAIMVSTWGLLCTTRNYRVNLIHSHHRWATVLAAIVSKSIQVPMIHNARVTFSNKRIFGKFAGDNIVAVSEGVKRNLINYFGIEQRKIRVIYNGIAIEKPTEVRMRRIRTETKLCEKARVISVIGRIAEQKGHTYLIEALPDVIERFPTLKILIVGEEDFGEGGLKRKLQARAQSLKVRDKVEFLGHQEDIAAFIGISEFTVLPSLREGLPGAAIESLLLGKPVVATDVGGTSEIIANMINGILIEPRNPKMLADAICYMLSHRDEVKRMGERGKKLAEGKFTIPRMLREYSEYYLSLLCGDQLGCARIDR